MSLFDAKDKSRYATFSRRTLMVTGGMTAVFATLAGRLYQLQILEGDQFMTRAEENRVSQRLVAPLRGRILDRFAQELANNRRNYRVLLIPEQASDGIDAALDTIGQIILITPTQRERIKRDIAQNKKFVPVTVAENLTWEEFARVNLHLPYLSGIQPDVGETRAYPFNDEMSHILGYVASVSPDDKKDDQDPLLDLPGFRIGKRGIEKQFDAEIRGTAGASRVEVNVYGRVIRELGHEPGTPGSDIYLTIDRDVQRFTAERMAGESAACVVMDVTNGDVLALCSTPGFDPNLFNVGINHGQWNALTSDDHTPLMNKALSGAYPPGSTFKPAMAMAAVEAGLDDLQVVCTGSITLGNNVFHCWKRGGHGHVDLHRGIQQSCDVFFYEVAKRLGIDKMEDAAHKLGLGERTGIEIPGERSGVIPGRAWKEQHYGVPWQQGETLVTGIGQGYVLVTPLQLCTLAARIASGNQVSPRITRVVGQSVQPRPQIKALPFSDKAILAVQSGMNAVCNEPGGTAYAWRIPDAGFEMAGKTGTAQVRRITKEERATGVKSNQSLPWKLRDHALFIAFAPVQQPRYACVCMIEHGAVGAHPQVQIARDVLLFAQQRNSAQLPTAYPVNAAGIDGVANRRPA
ncbi:MAG: penicillin-binding protein 2 [Proteobacteria bacterium]|nr:penicillin-binding protein 2 [Pseudomonadota bacterium]